VSTNIDAPTREQLVERVRQRVPALGRQADWAEQNRRLPDEWIEELADIGIFKLRIPQRFGGYEADTRTLIEVAGELARADGSLAWVTSVYWIPTWMAGLFPDEVQEEVFATDNVRVCGTLSPSAMATPVAGGIVVNGKWSFISGAHHSHWQEIIAVLVAPDSEPMPIMALVPISELTVVDDWQTMGLRGTGSVTTIAQELFVPQARVVPLPAVLQGQSSSLLSSAPMYRAPLLPVAAASSLGGIVGLARAAQESFLERLPGRKITYTDYTNQAEAPLTHLQVAAASMKVDEAEFHANRLATMVDTKCAAGEPWSMQERLLARGDLGATVRLAKEAVEVFADASGGSSIYSDVAIQRIHRDIQAVSLHALMHPDTNAELYGRGVCGLEPNTLYI